MHREQLIHRRELELHSFRAASDGAIEIAPDARRPGDEARDGEREHEERRAHEHDARRAEHQREPCTPSHLRDAVLGHAHVAPAGLEQPQLDSVVRARLDDRAEALRQGAHRQHQHRRDTARVARGQRRPRRRRHRARARGWRGRQ